MRKTYLDDLLDGRGSPTSNARLTMYSRAGSPYAYRDPEEDPGFNSPYMIEKERRYEKLYNEIRRQFGDFEDEFVYYDDLLAIML